MLEAAPAPSWTSSELETVIASRAWLHCGQPFRHIRARNVFTPEFYAALAAEMSEILARGLSDAPEHDRFSRSMPGYDAFGIGIKPGSDGPMSLFVSSPWRDLMCDLFGITPTPYVFAGAHHHLPGSAAGFVHNDFNPVWFPRAESDDIRVPDQELCDFKTGDGPLADEERVEVVRGAVVIYFLLNDGWTLGDGGETGLYAQTDGDWKLVSQCEPVDNSLLLFECTPQSFHGFLTNHRLRRSSIIMWVHRPLEEALLLYGEDGLERWKH